MNPTYMPFASAIFINPSVKSSFTMEHSLLSSVVLWNDRNAYWVAIRNSVMSVALELNISRSPHEFIVLV